MRRMAQKLSNSMHQQKNHLAFWSGLVATACRGRLWFNTSMIDFWVRWIDRLLQQNGHCWHSHSQSLLGGRDGIWRPRIYSNRSIDVQGWSQVSINNIPLDIYIYIYVYRLSLYIYIYHYPLYIYIYIYKICNDKMHHSVSARFSSHARSPF